MLNVSKLKHFFERVENSEEKEDATDDFNQTQDIYKDIFNPAPNSGPITRAQAKLITYKDTDQSALLLLKNKDSPNINSLCEPSDHCAECKREETYFQNQNTLLAQ